VASIVGFPGTVNERAARVVAAAVAVVAAITLLSGWYWLLVPLALGFLARVIAGPTLDPFARLAVHVVAPRLGPPKMVPGPPKRFAQAVGLMLSSTAAIAALWLDATAVADVLVATLLLFATLEAALGFCAGCWMFGQLMRVGLIPEATCRACADIRARA